MDDLEKEVIYIKGRIDQQIEGYANRLGLPPSVLAERLVQLLHPDRSWNKNKMSPLRENTPRVSKRLGATLEVVKRTHNNMQQGEGSEASKVSKIKEYWQRMTPEERKKEMDRRIALRNANMKRKK